jgi:hypothetical protein
VGKLEGKRPLGRPKRRLVNNTKTDLEKTGWDGKAGVIRLKIGTGKRLL